MPSTKNYSFNYSYDEVVTFNQKLLNDISDPEYDYKLTTDFKDAIYLLHDAKMISGGEAEAGFRHIDHRMIECTMEIDRYNENFWDEVHARFKIVRLVPESRYALIKKGQVLTRIQEYLIKKNGYIIEEY